MPFFAGIWKHACASIQVRRPLRRTLRPSSSAQGCALVSAIASASFILHIQNGLILARQARVSGWEAEESLACSLLVKAFVPVLIHA